MPSREELRKRRARLRRERNEAERRGIELSVQLDALERERETLKRKRDKHEGDGSDRLRELRARLQANHSELARINEQYDRNRTRVEKLTDRIKALARRIRNTIKPKIVDLNLVPAGPLSPQPYVDGSIGHYTAGPRAATDEDAVRLWRLVDQQHKSQGWSMIGYQIGLGPEGGVYLLRPLRYIGAHTLGKNTGQIGLSVHGTTGDTWTRAQKRALRYALKKYDLDSKPVTVHKDWNSTACPGSFEDGYRSKGK